MAAAADGEMRHGHAAEAGGGGAGTGTGRMNLNEYMVAVDRPLGVRFALAVDGRVFVHSLKKGVSICIISGSPAAVTTLLHLFTV
jgi:hypothetical protein